VAASAWNRRPLAALAPLRLARWPYDGPVAIREGEDLHVVDRWCHLGTVRSEADLWALLEQCQRHFEADTYRILRKALPHARVIRLGPRQSSSASSSSR
jgi:DNA polymerase-3 subunit epsilon